MARWLKRFFGYQDCPTCGCQHTWSIFYDLCGQCGIEEHIKTVKDT